MTERAGQSLLPGAPHADAERKPMGVFAIDLTCSRLGHVPFSINSIWSIDDCPTALLPWLAWTLGIAQWDADWTEAQKRQALRENYTRHLIKGTKQSVLNVLADGGYPNAQIREGINQFRYDGMYHYSGIISHQSTGHWAYYTIVLSGGDPAPSAELLARIERTAPARSRLYEIVYE